MLRLVYAYTARALRKRLYYHDNAWQVDLIRRRVESCPHSALRVDFWLERSWGRCSHTQYGAPRHCFLPARVFISRPAEVDTGWPEPSIPLHMFVAAQFVHFGAVAVLHTAFANGGLQLGIPQVIVVIAGFALVAGVGWTAIPDPGKRLRTAIHTVLLHLIFLFLLADYSQHPVRPLRWMLVPLAIALGLRHLPKRKLTSGLSSTPS